MRADRVRAAWLGIFAMKTERLWKAATAFQENAARNWLTRGAAETPHIHNGAFA